MVYLRHATRHVHQTLIDLVQDWMDSLSWFGPAELVPFGTTPVTFQVGRMDEATVQKATGNLLAVSFGDEPDQAEIELGGGLVLQEYVMFVDCLADTDAVALAMASDVKDRLQGVAPGTSRFGILKDYTYAPPADPMLDHGFEFTDVQRRKPDVGYRPNWHVVSATIELIHPEWG